MASPFCGPVTLPFAFLIPLYLVLLVASFSRPSPSPFPVLLSILRFTFLHR